MNHLLRDLRYGLRSLFRDSGFALTVVLTLAACIAANTATFAIVNSVLLRPLPVPDADSIVLMSNRYPRAGAGDSVNSSAADYFDRRERLTTLSEQAMFQNVSHTVDVNGAAEQLRGYAVTPSLFRLVQTAPALGRPFTDEEGEIGANRKVILTDALWWRLFGGDRAVIGRDLRLGGVPHTIVGVLPPGFVFVNPEVRYWVPLAFTAEQKAMFHSNDWYHIGRLRSGATVAQVQAQVDTLNAANQDRMPQLRQALIDAGFHTKVEPLQHMLVRDVEGALYLLWGGAVFVLLIGGLNIANLVLARLSVRGKEIATRMALGAGRAQVARQFFVENILVALTGGVAGILLGMALLRGLAAIGLDRFPRAAEVRIDAVVVLVALGLAVLVGILMGLPPAAALWKARLNDMLREGGRSGTSGSGARRLRQVLVGAEVAVAFVLLAGAGLLLASFRQLLAVDPGFALDGVLTATTNMPQVRYRGPVEVLSSLDRTLDAVRRLPGVAAAGATSAIPFGSSRSDSVILAEGYVPKPGESVISPRNLVVTPGYFHAMRMPILRGRDFEPRDNHTAAPVIIIDEYLARHFWPGQDPIGRRMYQPRPPDLTKVGPENPWLTVIGVVRSARLEDLAGVRANVGAYYFPFAQNFRRTFTLALRTTGDPGALLPALRTSLAGLDPDLALFDVRTMRERADLSLSSRRTSLLLAMGFAGLALLLSGIGIYGVLAYLVAQRRREIGIRVALGCTRPGVVRLVLREGLLLAAGGVAAGLAGAVALRKVVATQVYGVQPLDPLVLAGVVAALGFIAVVACVVPARRATQVDPAGVLADS